MNRFDLDFITHRRISDNRLVSLIVMAMLAFALTSLRAQSSATNTAAPVAALTPELMNKMLRLIALKGTDKELNPKVANEPRLATPWLGRYVSANGIPSNSIHSFEVSRGSDQDVVISVRSQTTKPPTIRIFRVHRDGKVVKAAYSDIRTGQVTILALDEAQKELDHEFAFWAEGVDRLIAGK